MMPGSSRSGVSRSASDPSVMFFPRLVTEPFGPRVDAAHDHALHAVLAGQHCLADGKGRRGLHVGNAVDFFLQGRGDVLDAVPGILHHDHMRDRGQDLVPEIALETGHDGQGDDGGGHPDHDARYGDEGVERHRAVTLLGPEITQADEYFVRSFHDTKNEIVHAALERNTERILPVSNSAFRTPHSTRHFSFFICGNRMTSRMELEPVSSMTSRSMPMPSPAAGGMPYSSARMKSSSIWCASSSPASRSRHLFLEPLLLVDGVVQFGKGIRQFPADDEQFEALDKGRIVIASSWTEVRCPSDNR